MRGAAAAVSPSFLARHDNCYLCAALVYYTYLWILLTFRFRCVRKQRAYSRGRRSNIAHFRSLVSCSSVVDANAIATSFARVRHVPVHRAASLGQRHNYIVNVRKLLSRSARCSRIFYPRAHKNPIARPLRCRRCRVPTRRRVLIKNGSV